MTKYRQVGGRLGAYIRANDPSTQQIQGLLGDLLAEDELLNPMRDVVARPLFAALRDRIGSGAGEVQRDALLQELARSYLPGVVDGVGQLVNGMLDQPAGETIYADSAPHQVPSTSSAASIATPADLATSGTAGSNSEMNTKTTSEVLPRNISKRPQDPTLELPDIEERHSQRIRKNKSIAAGILAISSAIGLLAILSTITVGSSQSCETVAKRLSGLGTDSNDIAMKLIEENKESCSDNPEFLTQQGASYLVSGRYDESINALDKAIALSPSSGKAYSLRGEAKENKGEYRDAITDYTKALALSPADEYTLYRRAGSLLSVSELDNALSDINQALTLKRDSFNLEMKGDILYQLGRFEPALGAYDQAIELSPDTASAYLGRATTKGFLNRHSDALKDVNKAIDLDPDSSWAYRLRGNIKTWLDDFEGACADFKKAKDLGHQSTKLHQTQGGGDISIDKDIKDACS